MKQKEARGGSAPAEGKQKKDAGSGSKSNARIKWLVTIFFLALLISATFSFLSQELLGTASMFGAFVVLLAIIVFGIFFDLLGVAVTAAEERPFHSMASRKVAGSQEAIWLLRNAGKVSSICCDVVGDICGVISGAAAAVVAVEAFTHFGSPSLRVLQLLLSALVAALTILGKAFCKQIALENSTPIVYAFARIIYRFKRIFGGKKQRDSGQNRGAQAQDGQNRGKS